MFLLNKYSSCYNSIIQRAKSRVLGKDVYSEKHHIIPRSMGGDNSVENIVKLTAREHFVCHLLLPKMTTGLHRYKMVHAIWQLSICNKNGKRHRPSSRIYENLKKQRREILKEKRGNKHHLYGKPGLRLGSITSDETKKKISESKIGSTAWNKGKSRTEEERSKISNTRKLRSSDPTWNIRPPCSKEKAEKIKKANIGKKWANNPTLKIRKYTSLEEATELYNAGWLPGRGKF